MGRILIGELLLRERGTDPETGRTVFELLEDFTVELGINGNPWKLTVPQGFLTDFASVPKRILGIPLWSIFPPWGKHNKAAVVHDWLYRGKIVDRFLADAVFRYIMKELTVGFFKRVIMFYAVRIGGRKAFGSKPPNVDNLIQN